jgi:hypothetical protein
VGLAPTHYIHFGSSRFKFSSYLTHCVAGVIAGVLSSLGLVRVVPPSANMARYRPLDRGSEDILTVGVVVLRPDRRRAENVRLLFRFAC